MPNKVQLLITEINRIQKTRETMRKRMNREDEILLKAKSVLRDLGVRPYNKRAKRRKVRTYHRTEPQKEVALSI